MPPGTGSGAIKWHRKEMYLETDRTIIRSIQPGDEKAYVEMAKDGSLAEIGFDEIFSDWAENWINEAVELTEKDDPKADHIPCTIMRIRKKSVYAILSGLPTEGMDMSVRLLRSIFHTSMTRKKNYTDSTSLEDSNGPSTPSRGSTFTDLITETSIQTETIIMMASVMGCANSIPLNPKMLFRIRRRGT